MKYKSKNFCLTIYPSTIKHILFLGLEHVILGQKFNKENFLSDRTLDNIAYKNKYYGEYTFHYWLWKNCLNELDDIEWLSFSTYRRFWINSNETNINSITDLKNNLLNSHDLIDKSYDVVLTKPLILGKTKRIIFATKIPLACSLSNACVIFLHSSNLFWIGSTKQSIKALRRKKISR